jgi:hypothetical protein
MAALFGGLMGFFDFRRDIIDYVATKQSGLSATSTRTVDVVALDSAESPTGSTSTRTVIIGSTVQADTASTTAAATTTTQ